METIIDRFKARVIATTVFHDEPYKALPRYSSHSELNNKGFGLPVISVSTDSGADDGRRSCH